MTKLTKEMSKVREDMRHFHRQTLVDSKQLLHSNSMRRPKPIDMEDSGASYSGIHSSTSARPQFVHPAKITHAIHTKSTSSPHKLTSFYAGCFRDTTAQAIAPNAASRGSEEHTILASTMPIGWISSPTFGCMAAMAFSAGLSHIRASR